MQPVNAAVRPDVADLDLKVGPSELRSSSASSGRTAAFTGCMTGAVPSRMAAADLFT